MVVTQTEAEAVRRTAMLQLAAEVMAGCGCYDPDTILQVAREFHKFVSPIDYPDRQDYADTVKFYDTGQALGD